MRLFLFFNLLLIALLNASFLTFTSCDQVDVTLPKDGKAGEKGDKGDPGTDGADGQDGNKGDKGDQGDG